MASMPNMSPLPVTPQQLQYQQAMLAATQRQQPLYPQMNGFANAAPSMDAFRNVAASPLPGPGFSAPPMLSQASFGQPGLPPMMGQQVYGYPVQYMPQPGQVGAGRRGRVSSISPTWSVKVNMLTHLSGELLLLAVT